MAAARHLAAACGIAFAAAGCALNPPAPALAPAVLSTPAPLQKVKLANKEKGERALAEMNAEYQLRMEAD
ncbi:MAG: hypothetical protein ACXWHB_12460, partial [Usitatibacter sp.]